MSDLRDHDGFHDAELARIVEHIGSSRRISHPRPTDPGALLPRSDLGAKALDPGNLRAVSRASVRRSRRQRRRWRRGTTAAASSRRPISCARRAASTSPSPAETIEPFMRMCHCRAKWSGSATPASAASSATKLADPGQLVAARLVDRVLAVVELEQGVDEQAALEAAAPEPGVEHVEDGQQAVRRQLGAARAPRPPATAAVHNCSRRSSTASTSASFERKWR